MILTCPQCDTKYVVKDGAIPVGGRQVRCASCKHSWHQDADETGQSEAPADAIGGPPMPATEAPQPAPQDASATDGATDGAAVGAMVAPDHGGADAGAGSAPPFEDNYGLTAPLIGAGQADPRDAVDQPAYDEDPPLSETFPDDEVGDGPGEAVDEGAGAEEDFSIRGFDEDEGSRSGRLFKALVVVLVLVAIAVAAFWYLAPADLRARIGLTGATSSPLKIMLDTRDRQKIESGNELLTISGRVINPTDEEQAVPAIRAELRNRQSQKLIYSWTIRPQARVLPPNGMTRFNSAEVDVPQGGDDISLSLGGE